MDGEWHRAASLRPLSGRDEDFLFEEGDSFTPASRTTALLTRCLGRLGPLVPPTSPAVRSLSVGDRDALMLHLRRLTLGERIACVLSCPNSGCNEKMDLELQIGELLLPPYPHQNTLHETVVETDEASYRVRFRLPNGEDQEAVAPLASTAAAVAVDRLLQRCVTEVVEESSGHVSRTLPPAVAQALPRRMAELDPQAELLLDLTCPACSVFFIVPFDVAEYFYQELCGQRDALYREVHTLAFHYHWNETEILSMTRCKRRLYLNLLADALSERRTA